LITSAYKESCMVERLVPNIHSRSPLSRIEDVFYAFSR
jgi:hypothetical protein